MQYLIGGLLVLAGLINLNLIRVALSTGKVQSRMFGYDRAEAPAKFWLAIIVQGLVSAALFLLAAMRLSTGNTF